MTRPASRLLALLALAVVAGGCGYSVGLRGNLPAHIKSVAVPIFRNNTPEPAIENTITSAVVNAFVTSGRVTIVPVDQADAILDGTITGYRLDLIAFTKDINVTDYRLTVTVNVRFRDVRENTVLYTQDGLEERADFRVQGQVSQTIAREDVAARQAAVDIGRKIVASTLDRF
jgi:outer membrane lipopolysaccharide assembly protein LptE/RlpB